MCGYAVAVHFESVTLRSTHISVSVCRLMTDGLYCLFASCSVATIAIPYAIRLFSPSHTAAAVFSEWNLTLTPMSSSADSVANDAPSFSSSRQVFGYSAIRLLSRTICASSATSVPSSETYPSNIDLDASTSTVLAPQAHPISRPCIPSGSAMPRLTSPRVTRPS